MKKLIVFIDNSYLNRETRKLGRELDYQKLVNFLTNSAIELYNLSRVIIYCSIDYSVPHETLENQKKYRGIINQIPKFEVKQFYLKIIYDQWGEIDEKVERGINVALVTDLVSFACRDSYDVAILCSGDDNLFPAVEYIKNIGKEIYVASFDDTSSTKLVESSLGNISLTKNSLHLGESNPRFYNRVYIKNLSPP